jgi:hypothetical protein
LANVLGLGRRELFFLANPTRLHTRRLQLGLSALRPLQAQSQIASRTIEYTPPTSGS